MQKNQSLADYVSKLFGELFTYEHTQAKINIMFTNFLLASSGRSEKIIDEMMEAWKMRCTSLAKNELLSLEKHVGPEEYEAFLNDISAEGLSIDLLIEKLLIVKEEEYRRYYKNIFDVITATFDGKTKSPEVGAK